MFLKVWKLSRSSLLLGLAGAVAGCSSNHAIVGSAASQAPQTKPPVMLNAGPVPGRTSGPQLQIGFHGKRIKVTGPIRFQFEARKGRKLITKSLITREDSSGSQFVASTRYVSELVSVTDGNALWKTTYNQNVESMGQHEFSFGRGPAKNRLELITLNRYGNLVSAEGCDPDAPLVYQSFPEKPVHVGGTWSGWVRYKSEKAISASQLEGIELVKGRKYAVISSSVTLQGLQKKKLWLDLKTGDTDRIEETGESRDLEGSPFHFTLIIQVLGQDGKPVLS